jgi:plastocyanin
MKQLCCLLMTAVAAIVACSGDDLPSNPTDGNTANTVAVGNNVFTPSAISVPAGTTVTWQWNSNGVVHNVTFEDQVTSNDRSEGSFPRTFTAAGTYPYQCTIHGSQGMTGTVTVTSAQSGGSGGDGTGSGGSGGGGGNYP